MDIYANGEVWTLAVVYWRNLIIGDLLRLETNCISQHIPTTTNAFFDIHLRFNVYSQYKMAGKAMP